MIRMVCADGHRYEAYDISVPCPICNASGLLDHPLVDAHVSGMGAALEPLIAVLDSRRILTPQERLELVMDAAEKAYDLPGGTELRPLSMLYAALAAYQLLSFAKCDDCSATVPADDLQDSRTIDPATPLHLVTAPFMRCTHCRRRLDKELP